MRGAICRRWILAGALVAATFASAPRAQAADYLMARLRDLRDIAILDIGIGYLAFEIDFRATDYFTFCLGAAESRRARILGKWTELFDAPDEDRFYIDEGWIAPLRWEANVGFPCSNLAGFDTDHYSGWCTWLAVPEFIDVPRGGPTYNQNWLFFDDPKHEKPLADKFDLAFGFTIPFLAARLGLSPGNFIDFFAGFFGFDPADDGDRF